MTKAQVKVQNALDVMLKRRSIRDFDERIVPQNIVQDMVRAAALAPTSCNMQLYHFVIVDNPELLEEFKKPVTGKINWCRQMAVLLVDPKITFENEANYISAGMVVQNFLLRATELGVGTCPIAGFKGKDILKQKINIPERYDIPLLIFFGYSKEMGSDPHVPYRLPTEKTYSYNEFAGDMPFPTTSSAKEWTQQAIFDYRRRILSVYFPRFGHSIWGSTYIDSVWPYIEGSIKQSKHALYIFPWEKTLLDRLRSVMPPHSLDILDENMELLASTKNSFSELIKDAYDFSISESKRKYDTILMVGSLEFNSDADALFEYASKNLNAGGSFIIATAQQNGLLGIYMRISELIGKQRHVYHESLFYKLGPRHFRSKRNIIAMAEKNNMKLASFVQCNSRFIENKVKNGLIGKFVSLASSIFLETGIYHFVRR